jgi:hypothetical protein
VNRTGRRIAAAASLVAFCLLPLVARSEAHATLASSANGEVILVTVDDASLVDLLADPELSRFAGAGGAGLMVVDGSGDLVSDLSDRAAVAERELSGRSYGLGSLVGPNAIPPSGVARQLRTLLESSSADEVIAIVASNGPPPDERRADGVGSVIVARGAPAELAALMDGDEASPSGTLTSDSTRRIGVVTSTDVVESGLAVSGLGDAAFERGSPIEVVDAPPPIGLYERYLDQRQLVVPVGVVTGSYAFAAGLLGLVLLLARTGSARLRATAGWAAIAVVPLTAGLMLVGHLDRLTYARVFAFLAAVAVLTLLGMAVVQRVRGSLGAIAALGAGLLAMFAVEATLGWTATLTPLLGGAQLDGGRFFGLPNVQIGLLMGASLYVAQRLRSWVAGVALILAAALFAGLPWTGSNIGAAVTIAAAAGIWWGLRADGSRLRPVSILRVLATVTGTVVVVVVAHRYLTDAPTHISRFASDTRGLAGLWDRFVDRLGVGADLIARNPFGLIPALGILATLVLVLRPPAGLRPSLSAHPAWRDALVTILLGSVVAYVANDSGAAAIGLGFGTALGGLLYVSLTDAPAKMEAP